LAAAAADGAQRHCLLLAGNALSPCKDKQNKEIGQGSQGQSGLGENDRYFQDVR